ncbi:MAG: PAS domain S-box protein, partial [Bacteroidota bacterium]
MSHTILITFLSYVLQMAGTVVFAIVLRHFHKTYKYDYLQWWERSWWSYTIYLAGALFALVGARTFPASHPLRIITSLTTISAGYLQVLWLLGGAYILLTEKTITKAFFKNALVLIGIVALFTTFLFINVPGISPERLFVRVGSRSLILALAFISAGILVLRSNKEEAFVGKKILAIAILLYGANQFLFFAATTCTLLKLYEFIPYTDYLSLVDFLFQFLIGMGTVVWFQEHERKHSQTLSHTLTATEKIHHLLTEHSFEANALLAEDGTILSASHTASKLFGFNNGDIIGANIFECIYTDDLPHTSRLFSELLLQPGKVVNTKFRALTRNGNILWLESIVHNKLHIAGIEGIIANFRDVSNDIILENKIFEKEKQLSTLVYSLPIAFYTCDTKGEIILYNNAAVELWGRTPETNNDFWCGSCKIFDTEGNPVALENCPMALTMQEGKPMRGYEIIIERPDGSRRNVLPYPDIIRNASGEIIGAMNMLVDITERKQAEENIKKLRKAVDAANDIIFMTDTDGIFTSVNAAFTTQYGYTAEEVIGKATPRILKGGLMSQEFYVSFWDSILHNHTVSQELVNKTKEGKLVTVEVSVSPIVSGGNLPIGFLSIQRNITERKHAEKALRESESKFRNVFEHSPLGKSMTEIDGTLKVNKAFCDIVGYSEEELTGKHWKEITPPDDIPKMLKLVQSLIDGKTSTMHIEKRYIHKNGSLIWTDLITALQRDEKGNPLYFITTINNITERKRAELELLQQKHLLAEAQQMAKLGSWEFNLQQKKITWSNELYQVYEIETEKFTLTLESFMQLIHPDDRTKMAEMTHDAMSGKKVSDHEFRIITAAGKTKFMFGATQAIKDEEENIVRIIGTVQDITERKHNEQLQHSLYQIATAAESAGTVEELFAVVHSIVKEIMYAENFYIALHNEESGIISFPYFVDAYDEIPVPQPMRSGLTEYILHTGTSLLCNAEEQDVLAENNAIENIGTPAPIWLGVPLIIEGKTIGVMVVQDYHNPNTYGEKEKEILEFVSAEIAKAIASKQKELALENSEKRYRDLFESNPLPMWVYDIATLHFLAVNNAAILHYGYSKEEFLSMTIKDIRPKEELPALMNNLTRVRTKHENSGIWKHRKKDGKIIEAEIISHEIIVEERKARIVSVNDVTERKRLESQLLQANKMEAIGQL